MLIPQLDSVAADPMAGARTSSVFATTLSQADHPPRQRVDQRSTQIMIQVEIMLAAAAAATSSTWAHVIASMLAHTLR